MSYKDLSKTFEDLITSDKLSHSYIFFGENQKEIFNFARNLANFLETGNFSKPKTILQDLSVISPNEKGNIGIDEIRDLKRFLYSRPVISKKKTAIVVGFENLTDYAQGAILKIVEEPPKQSLIILVGQNPDNLFATAASRFQKIYFSSNGLESDKKPQKKNGNNDDQLEKLTELITKLKKDPKKNLAVLKEALNRLSLMKRFNLNKKLQVRLVEGLLKNAKK